MSSPYDSSFRKVASTQELPAGRPRVFRAAGATVVLRRDGEDYSAIDGSCISDGREVTSAEWEQLHDRAGLPVRVEDGAVWVCLEGCGGHGPQR